MFGLFKRKSAVTDEDAMSEYQNGDTESFEILLARYNRRIFTFILRMVYGNTTVAEDLFQEVFIKVIENRHSFDSTRTFRSWIYGIARNHVIDHLRKEGNRRHLSLDKNSVEDGYNVTRLELVKSKAPDQEQLMYDRQTRDKLFEELSHLNDEYKEVFMMREIEGLKFDEIAGITQTNVNTVKSRHRYAFRELRKQLFGTGYFEEMKDTGER